MVEDIKHPEGTKDVFGKSYLISPMGMIDLMSILPFWLGFLPIFAPYLGIIRALRILRAFKLFRYNRHMQLFAVSIYKGWWMIKSAGIVAFIFNLMASALLFEFERKAQPDSFGNIWNIICWFIPVSDSTIGYGDMSPVTPAGKLITVLLVIVPGVAIGGAVIGAMTNSFHTVMEHERKMR